ncbi:hypothetical protein JD276_15260 [Leucobacter sp. CSA1]|uniref:Uncharacterized protein n=1 Tax=Leucobacter chromiisoli TaxID=2796471 RepID=A0A934Q9I0_9MICO|nr:hypothetical protein [Leucobacter chromiisoli]MBK0420386.1 hypothetical protein [Leucobacter chromiisoli]
MPEYMSPDDVAEMIPGMTVTKLAQLRFKGQGPKYMKPSPKVCVYDRADVIEWLESTKRTGTKRAEEA